MSTDATRPDVSVIMGCSAGGRHVATAVSSVLRQTLTDLELVIVIAGSDARGAATARAAIAEDGRAIVIEAAGGDRRRGLDQALAQATGRWIALVDGEDYLHPERLEKLIEQAERDGADIAADDQLLFWEDASRPPRLLLSGARAAAPSWAPAAEYLRESVPTAGRRPPLYRLKPVIRRDAVRPNALRIGETPQAAEDHDLVARLMLEGASLRLYPEPLYFRRASADAASEQPTVEELDALLAGHDGMAAPIPVHTPVGRALARRRAMLVQARRPSRPTPPGSDPVPDADRAAPPPGKRIALLSRQRIVGSTNGSSNYVLGIAGALAKAGYEVDFIGASPKLFGRWPLLRLRPETRVFSSYKVRGSVRIGPFIVATDPRIAWRGALAAMRLAAGRLVAGLGPKGQALPHAIAARAERADLLYVARTVRPGLCAVLCDYAFLTPLAPYALAPRAEVATIMHDLMSARVRNDETEPAPPEIEQLTAAAEFRLLSLSDLVIAIQPDEEARVRERLPLVRTVLAPWAAERRPEPQPGEDDLVLFVGSNTAPNVGGLRWFLDACWPIVQRERPRAELLIAGSVGRAVGRLPPNARSLGVVDSLEPFYRDAGVVIAPLRSGSGLKIKLVEALAAGKAVVGTKVCVQGVESLVREAMVISDEPEAFARAVASLMSDRERRLALAAAALACVGENFTPEACYAPLLERLGRGGAAG